MPRETRGYATTIVAALGICGGLVAVLVGEFFDWRTAFIVGGVMGIALLLLRIGVNESGLFEQVKTGSLVARSVLPAARRPAPPRRTISASSSWACRSGTWSAS